MNEILARVEPKIDQGMNDFLMKDFTKDKIKAAVMSIGSTKVPGFDGFPTIFFRDSGSLLERKL